jgi:hypothetical protein
MTRHAAVIGGQDAIGLAITLDPLPLPKWQEHVDSMSPWLALGLGPALQHRSPWN